MKEGTVPVPPTAPALIAIMNRVITNPAPKIFYFYDDIFELIL